MYPTQIVICKALAVVVSTQIRTVPAWVVFGDRVLFHSLSKKRSGGGQVLQKIGGDAVALLKIFGIVVGEPDLSLRVLPGEGFEWEVDGGAGSGDHDGRAAFGIAEDEELGGAHFESGFGGFAAVVDEGEDGDAFFFENGLQAGEGFRNGVGTGDVDDA